MENKIVSNKNPKPLKAKVAPTRKKYLPTEKYILQAELNVISVDPFL